MTQQSVSESRFFMWRAVFAMVHADGKVTDEERKFVENYLQNTAFSDEQKAILCEDLHTPQSINEMLMGVADPGDQADFFQFVHMLAWSDGDYDAREQEIIDRLTAEQMNRFNRAEISQKLRDMRQAAAMRRGLENEEYKKQARDVAGLGNVIRFVVPWMEVRNFEPPGEEVFNLWRAVFALVHVDGEISSEERGYVEGMMEVFRFSEEQRRIVEEDLMARGDVQALFDQIQDQEHKRQFFVMARTVVWCDGLLHDEEKATIDRIKESLGGEAEQYNPVIQWIDRKPVVPEGDALETGEEKMMKGVVRQMIDFYKEQAA